jgi:hypothetical protein
LAGGADGDFAFKAWALSGVFFTTFCAEADDFADTGARVFCFSTGAGDEAAFLGFAAAGDDFDKASSDFGAFSFIDGELSTVSFFFAAAAVVTGDDFAAADGGGASRARGEDKSIGFFFSGGLVTGAADLAAPAGAA